MQNHDRSGSKFAIAFRCNSRGDCLLWRNGEPGGTRTRDHRIKSAMLYQLSYRPALQFEFQDSIGVSACRTELTICRSVHAIGCVV